MNKSSAVVDKGVNENLSQSQEDNLFAKSKKLGSDTNLSFASLYTSAELELIRRVVLVAKGQRGWRTFAQALNEHWQQPDLFTPSKLRRLAQFGLTKNEVSGILLTLLPYLAPFSEYSQAELRAIALGKTVSFETLTPSEFRRLCGIFKASCIKRGFVDRPVACLRSVGSEAIAATTAIGLYEFRIGQQISGQDWEQIVKACYQVVGGTDEAPSLGDTPMSDTEELKSYVKES